VWRGLGSSNDPVQNIEETRNKIAARSVPRMVYLGGHLNGLSREPT
jgi:hypothetical protein